MLLSSQLLAIHTARMPNAAFSAQATAVKAGKRFCTKTRIRAASMLRLIRTIRTSCLPLFGRHDAPHGVSPAAVRAADSTVPLMEAQPGNESKNMDCRKGHT